MSCKVRSAQTARPACKESTALEKLESPARLKVLHQETRVDVHAENPDDVASPRRRLAKEIMGANTLKNMTIRELLSLRWRANSHPVAVLLSEHATNGCPVSVGRNWMAAELKAAAKRGPHIPALEPDVIKQIQVEVQEKAARGFAKICTWEELKKNLPTALKLPPLVVIPHKPRKYRVILDLSFALKLAGYNLPSVNKATEHCTLG